MATMPQILKGLQTLAALRGMPMAPETYCHLRSLLRCTLAKHVSAGAGLGNYVAAVWLVDVRELVLGACE